MLKLVYRVVIPIIFGQILQFFFPTVVKFVATHKPKFGKIQEFCLCFIVFTVFSTLFLEKREGVTTIEVKGWQVLVLALFILILLLFYMGVSWVLFGFFYSQEPDLRIMAFYGCHHKTVAMGLPLIKAIYEENPKLGLYCLPLLIWHPMQLVIGTTITAKFKKWIDAFPKKDEEKGEINNEEK